MPVSELIVGTNRNALRVEPTHEQLVAARVFAETVNDKCGAGSALDRPVVYGELRSVACAEACAIDQCFGSFKAC